MWCGPPGGANAYNVGYHTSMNLETRQRQSCIAYNSRFAVILGSTIQDVDSAFSPDQSVLNFCSTAIHGRSAADVQGDAV